MYLKALKAFVLWTVAFCMITAGSFFIEAKHTAKDAQVFMATTNKRLTATDQNINALLIQLALVADNVRRASESQRIVTIKTVAILKHTDQLLKEAQGSLKAVSAHSVQTIDELKAPIADMDMTLRSLNRVVQDQNIPKTLANVEQTSAQASVAARHVAETSDDVHQIAKHYEEEVVKPVSAVKRWAGYLLTGLKAVMLFK